MSSRMSAAGVDATTRKNAVDQCKQAVAQAGGEAVNQYQAQLNAMSPAERRRQAAVDGERLSDVDSADALPLVQLNPKFYDNTVGATVPQLIAVTIPGLQSGRVPFGFGDGTEDGVRTQLAIGARLRDQLDWAALEGLVRRSAR
jgi:hypothetical protein